MKNAVRILFCSNRNPLSVVIRASTWSRWSHVALVDGESVIEATGLHGVRRAPLWDVLSHAVDHAFVDIPANDPAGIIEAAASQIGKPYDYSALLGLALHRDWQRENAWFCSELIAWAFEQNKQPLLRSEVLRRVTPQHLWMLPPALGVDLHAATPLSL